MEYDDTNSGILFQNDKEGNDKRPDYTGKVNVEGVEFRLAGWKRLSKTGKPFLSLKVSEPQQEESGYDKARQARDSLKQDMVHEVDDEPINLSDTPF